MGEPKKRIIMLELTDKETAAFYKMCVRDDVTPEEVLATFICNLTGAQRSSGSDERSLANEYYERCGYEFFTDPERRTFLQWLLCNEYIYTMEELLDDLETEENELLYYETHEDEEAPEGLLEALQDDIENCKEQIAEFFREYEEKATGKKDLEEELQGVRKYIAKIKNINEGGTI